MADDKLTLGKVVAVMLSEQAADLPANQRMDAKFVHDALTRGHLWALRWRYPWLGEEDTPSHVANEVSDILTMWRVIEHAYSELPENEQIEVREDVAPFGVEFSGFDGNDSRGHYGAAAFMVETLGSFEELRCRELNSHAPLVLERYRKMLERYKQLPLGGQVKPSKEQLKVVLVEPPPTQTGGISRT